MGTWLIVLFAVIGVLALALVVLVVVTGPHEMPDHEYRTEWIPVAQPDGSQTNMPVTTMVPKDKSAK